MSQPYPVHPEPTYVAPQGQPQFVVVNQPVAMPPLSNSPQHMSKQTL